MWCVSGSLERFPAIFPNQPCAKPSCPNGLRIAEPSCPKLWAIAQAFCSKSANVGPLRIHPKSTRTIPWAVINSFSIIYEAFQRIWSDFRHLHKSAMFKTIGKAFCSNRPISDPCDFLNSTQTVSQAVGNPFSSIQEMLQGDCSDLTHLPKSVLSDWSELRPLP